MNKTCMKLKKKSEKVVRILAVLCHKACIIERSLLGKVLLPRIACVMCVCVRVCACEPVSCVLMK